MDRKCENCRHFVQSSLVPSNYVWGICMKPGQYRYNSQHTKKPGTFTRADQQCDDFEPAQKSAD